MEARQWRLTVEGELSDRAGQAFAGMALSHVSGNTVLVGRVQDQAELQGHLQRVSDLGLTLLDATVVEATSRP
jgi:outer membrane PBP1 activator LpoA protein